MKRMMKVNTPVLMDILAVSAKAMPPVLRVVTKTPSSKRTREAIRANLKRSTLLMEIMAVVVSLLRRNSARKVLVSGTKRGLMKSLV